VADNDFPFTVITPDGTFKGRLTEEDVLEVATEVNIEPVYENTTKALLEAVASSQHEKPYLALWSILDQVRYLVQTDYPAYQRVLEWLARKQEAQPNIDEDQHLEADYEDRGGYPDLDAVDDGYYSPELDG
jgi:hypothetical protein